MSALRELFSAISNSFKWWVIIAPWEQALRIRGGKHAKLLEPGVHFRVPFWDRIYVQPTRVRVMSPSAQTLETADGKVLALQLLIAFRVTDLLAMYENLHSPSDTIQGFAMGLASDYVQKSESAHLSPESLVASVEFWLGDKVGGYGVGDLEVSVSNFVYAPRAYRLITGGLESEIWGGNVSMHHDRED